MSVRKAPELRIEPYSGRHQAAARAFNERMRAAHAPVAFLLPEKAAKARARRGVITKHQHVVLEGDTVRGGVILQEQPHWLAGRTRTLWNVQAPLSEGIADRRYGFVGAFLMNALLRRNPLIYSVGMGSASLPYPRLLTALRWELTEVPFFFRVCNAATFLREVRALRTSRTMSALVALAAKSRLGPLAIHALQAWRETRPAGSWAVAEPCTSFGAWTDDVWEASRPDYLLCAVRNQETLSCLYPGKSDRLTKLQVRLGGKPIGWAVVLLNDLQDHKYFGRMRLGMIVDCMAPQAYAVQVVQAAAATLQELAVDLIVTNQSHRAWKAAFERSGFLSGPSNYLLGVSREVTRLAGMSQSELVNINRGDGDGITNL